MPPKKIAEKSDSRRQAETSSTFDRQVARKKLLEHLRLVSHYCPGYWFKADLFEGGVLIRMFQRRNGLEACIAETRQTDKFLACVWDREFFEKLVKGLIERKFPIEKEGIGI